MWILLFLVFSALAGPEQKAHSLERKGITGEKLIKLYKKACDKGSASACISAAIKNPDPMVPVRVFGELCEQGHARACTYSEFYERGCELGDDVSCAAVDDPYTALAAMHPVIEFSHQCRVDNLNPCDRLGVFLSYKSPADPTCATGDADDCYDQALDLRDRGGDPEKVIALYEEGCNLNDADSCFQAAWELGAIGTEAAVDRSRGLYEKACDLKIPEACFNLGRELRDERRDAEALPYFTRACDLGHGNGCIDARRLRIKDPERARQVAEEARDSCAAGKLGACAEWGWYVRKGTGIEADPERAVTIFETACNQGGAQACVGLINSLAYGVGADEDGARALELAQPWCADDVANACELVGLIHVDALGGVPVDRDLGLDFLLRSCDLRKNSSCKYAVEVLEERGQSGDYERSQQILQKSCSWAYAPACVMLGKRLRDGGDLNASVPYFERGCEAKDRSGCFYLAYALEMGEGVSVDKPRAATLYQGACDRGSTAACGNLALMKRHGQGIPKDLRAAAQLYETSCFAGRIDDCNQAGYLHKQGNRFAAAERNYTKACDGRNGQGCRHLAFLYDGLGTKDGYEKAARFFELGCRYGDARGCMGLGYALEVGEGIAQDQPRARKLYTDSCDREMARACTNLGTMLRDGKGGEQDLVGAEKQLRRGCELEDEYGCYVLGLALEKGTFGTADMPQARSFFEKSCKKKDPDGCGRLAMYLIEGRGGAKEPERARELIATTCPSHPYTCTNFGIGLGIGYPDKVEEQRQFYRTACERGHSNGCNNYGVSIDTAEPTRAMSYYAMACEKKNENACNNLYDALGDGTPVSEVNRIRYRKIVCEDGGLCGG